MQKKTILITGGAGFIGSHLVEYLLNKYSYYEIINLDSLTYAADLTRLNSIKDHPRYTFIKGNICDALLVNNLFSTYDIFGLFHLAAESHVDNSITNPAIFIETNVKGTFTLLEAAKNHWVKGFQNRFLHVSTDEVYGSLGETGYFLETTPYAPNSPYSASKAASDFLVRSYFHTYNLPILISNCSNNYGPKQHDEKLIPTIIRNALTNKAIPIYGNGKNIRDWLYVIDHCSALDRIFHDGITGENYNIGTHNERTNLDIATLICQILDRIKPLKTGSYSNQISYVKDRLGHDFRYGIDNTKICTNLNWKSSNSFNETLEDTVKWYIDHYRKIISS